jgi:hypothetical protein
MSAEVPPSIVPVRSLDALRRGDAGYAGGKGANLGELMSPGVPVPPGFVVGAPAMTCHAAMWPTARATSAPASSAASRVASASSQKT